MIYIEKNTHYTSLFSVDSIDGIYFGWNNESVWEGARFELFPSTGGFTQAFLAPSILDRW